MSNDEKLELKLITSLFNDITPKDPSKEYEILHINYDYYAEFVNSYFKAILEKDEISERVFYLTELVIELSASNYMAWYIRRRCIDSVVEFDKKKELEWLNKITLQNPKNYQIWNHRKILSEHISNYSTEIEIIDNVLLEDSKNYHAWCHRIWVTRAYDKFEEQVEFVNEMIKNDVRNNSAWNFRYFLNEYLKFDINLEVEYSLLKLKEDTGNESVLSYLIGLSEKSNIFEIEILKIFCDELLKKEIKQIKEPILLELLIEYIKQNKQEDYKKTIESIYSQLSEIDYIRKKYWLMLKNQLS